MTDRRSATKVAGLCLALLMTLNVGSLYTLKSSNNQLANQVKTLDTQIQESHQKVNELEHEVNHYRKLEEDILRPVEVSRNTSRPRIVSAHKVMATAYGSSPMNGGAGTGKAAIGVKPVEGVTIAVDPNMIPLGSKVMIDCPSYPEVNGLKIAQDTGGDIVGNRIDIYFDDITSDPIEANKRMRDFGFREVTIYVVKE